MGDTTNSAGGWSEFENGLLDGELFSISLRKRRPLSQMSARRRQPEDDSDQRDEESPLKSITLEMNYRQDRAKSPMIDRQSLSQVSVGKKEFSGRRHATSTIENKSIQKSLLKLSSSNPKGRPIPPSSVRKLRKRLPSRLAQKSSNVPNPRGTRSPSPTQMRRLESEASVSKIEISRPHGMAYAETNHTQSINGATELHRRPSSPEPKLSRRMVQELHKHRYSSPKRRSPRNRGESMMRSYSPARFRNKLLSPPSRTGNSKEASFFDASTINIARSFAAGDTFKRRMANDTKIISTNPFTKPQDQTPMRYALKSARSESNMSRGRTNETGRMLWERNETSRNPTTKRKESVSSLGEIEVLGSDSSNLSVIAKDSFIFDPPPILTDLVRTTKTENLPLEWVKAQSAAANEMKEYESSREGGQSGPDGDDDDEEDKGDDSLSNNYRSDSEPDLNSDDDSNLIDIPERPSDASRRRPRPNLSAGTPLNSKQSPGKQFKTNHRTEKNSIQRTRSSNSTNRNRSDVVLVAADDESNWLFHGSRERRPSSSSSSSEQETSMNQHIGPTFLHPRSLRPSVNDVKRRRFRGQPANEDEGISVSLRKSESAVEQKRDDNSRLGAAGTLKRFRRAPRSPRRIVARSVQGEMNQGTVKIGEQGDKPSVRHQFQGGIVRTIPDSLETKRELGNQQPVLSRAKGRASKAGQATKLWIDLRFPARDLNSSGISEKGESNPFQQNPIGQEICYIRLTPRYLSAVITERLRWKATRGSENLLVHGFVAHAQPNGTLTSPASFALSKPITPKVETGKNSSHCLIWSVSSAKDTSRGRVHFSAPLDDNPAYKDGSRAAPDQKIIFGVKRGQEMIQLGYAHIPVFNQDVSGLDVEIEIVPFETKKKGLFKKQNKTFENHDKVYGLANPSVLRATLDIKKGPKQNSADEFVVSHGKGLELHLVRADCLQNASTIHVSSRSREGDLTHAESPMVLPRILLDSGDGESRIPLAESDSLRSSNNVISTWPNLGISQMLSEIISCRSEALGNTNLNKLSPNASEENPDDRQSSPKSDSSSSKLNKGESKDWYPSDTGEGIDDLSARTKTRNLKSNVASEARSSDENLVSGKAPTPKEVLGLSRFSSDSNSTPRNAADDPNKKIVMSAGYCQPHALWNPHKDWDFVVDCSTNTADSGRGAPKSTEAASSRGIDNVVSTRMDDIDASATGPFCGSGGAPWQSKHTTYLESESNGISGLQLDARRQREKEDFKTKGTSIASFVSMVLGEHADTRPERHRRRHSFMIQPTVKDGKQSHTLYRAPIFHDIGHLGETLHSTSTIDSSASAFPDLSTPRTRPRLQLGESQAGRVYSPLQRPDKSGDSNRKEDEPVQSGDPNIGSFAALENLSQKSSNSPLGRSSDIAEEATERKTRLTGESGLSHSSGDTKEESSIRNVDCKQSEFPEQMPFNKNATVENPALTSCDSVNLNNSPDVSHGLEETSCASKSVTTCSSSKEPKNPEINFRVIDSLSDKIQESTEGNSTFFLSTGSEEKLRCPGTDRSGFSENRDFETRSSRMCSEIGSSVSQNFSTMSPSDDDMTNDLLANDTVDKKDDPKIENKESSNNEIHLNRTDTTRSSLRQGPTRIKRRPEVDLNARRVRSSPSSSLTGTPGDIDVHSTSKYAGEGARRSVDALLFPSFDSTTTSHHLETDCLTDRLESAFGACFGFDGLKHLKDSRSDGDIEEFGERDGDMRSHLKNTVHYDGPQTKENDPSKEAEKFPVVRQDSESSDLHLFQPPSILRQQQQQQEIQALASFGRDGGALPFEEGFEMTLHRKEQSPKADNSKVEAKDLAKDTNRNETLGANLLGRQQRRADNDLGYPILRHISPERLQHQVTTPGAANLSSAILRQKRKERQALLCALSREELSLDSLSFSFSESHSVAKTVNPRKQRQFVDRAEAAPLQKNKSLHLPYEDFIPTRSKRYSVRYSAALSRYTSKTKKELYKSSKPTEHSPSTRCITIDERFESATKKLMQMSRRLGITPEELLRKLDSLD